MKRKVRVEITYDTGAATKQGILNVLGFGCEAIREIKEIKPSLSCSYSTKICPYRSEKISEISKKKDWNKCGDCQYLGYWKS